MSGSPATSQEDAPHAAETLFPVPTCMVCGSAERQLRFRDGPYEVLACSSCGLVYVSPRRDPARLKEIYQTAYWHSERAKEFGYTDYLRDEPLYLRTYRRRHRIIARHFDRPGRVLDVGCAAGYFLAVMKEKGWSCCGVEVSGYIADFARRRHALEEIHTGTLEEADLKPASFDLITFWDVVEHLPDPLPILRRAAELLAPGGRILIETQNVSSRFARLLGKRWQHYKHHEHLYHFNPQTIAMLAERSGLRVIENRAALGGKYVSMGFIVERAGRVHPVFSALLAPLRLLGRVSIYVNLFDEMIVVCEKR